VHQKIRYLCSQLWPMITRMLNSEHVGPYLRKVPPLTTLSKPMAPTTSPSMGNGLIPGFFDFLLILLYRKKPVGSHGSTLRGIRVAISEPCPMNGLNLEAYLGTAKPEEDLRISGTIDTGNHMKSIRLT
jgi:hypothetical protein